MIIVTTARSARCKDCKYLQSQHLGKRKTHRCVNPMSPRFNTKIRLRDLACEEWEIK